MFATLLEEILHLFILFVTPTQKYIKLKVFKYNSVINYMKPNIKLTIQKNTIAKYYYLTSPKKNILSKLYITLF